MKKNNIDNKDFIDKVNELKTVPKLIEHYKVSRSVIYRKLKELNITNYEKEYKGWVPNSIDDFIEDYNELKSSTEMAKKYGITRETILKFAKRINYKNTYRASLTKEEEYYILSQYEFKSSTDLSKELEVSRALITKIWRVNGLSGKSSRIYYCDFDFFENIDSPAKAYFLGVMASDGCVYKRKNAP